MAEPDQDQGPAQGEDASPAPRSAPTTPARTGSRIQHVLAALALLAALVAGGGTAYLYWQQWQDDPEARIQTMADALEGGLRDAKALDTALADRLAEVEAAVGRLQAGQDEYVQALADIRSALAEAAVRTIAAAPEDGRQWKLAEVEYLLRVANHRLLMERDAGGARQLLASADSILAELDDFAFHDVRAHLAVEIAALGAFQGVDVPGLYLRIEALKGLLDRLPLRLPEYVAGDEAESGQQPPGDSSVLELLAYRLGDLVRFRRHDGAALRPLLPPQQAAYLEQHLRLALDRAQLALLRRDQAIFHASLGAAREWLDRFLDAGRAATAEVAAELDELLAIDLEQPVPDISASLARLRVLRRADSDPGE